MSFGLQSSAVSAKQSLNDLLTINSKIIKKVPLDENFSGIRKKVSSYKLRLSILESAPYLEAGTLYQLRIVTY